MKKLVALLVLSFSFYFCNGQGSCVNGGYQFSDMVSIFQSNNCLGCHGQQGGLNLSDYQNVITGGNNGMGGCGQYATALDFLVGKVDGTLSQLAGCGNPMPAGTPFGAPGMPQADIQALQAWIASGAPEFCPTVSACQGIDLNAGLPSTPTEACSGDQVDICLTLLDPNEGLIITGSINGTPTTLVGTPGIMPNQLCVSLTAPINMSCAPTDVNIDIFTIQCNNGMDYPGILFGPTLVDDLIFAGQIPIDIPVYPSLIVATSGDNSCGMLTADLVAMDGSICATAPSSPFTCMSDGDALAYDFTPYTSQFFPAPPVGCPLPPLMGTLSCAGCPSVGCPSVLNLNNNPEATGMYEADDTVISTSTVNAGSQGPVRYVAGDDGIILNANFCADGTVDFEAIIVDCDPNN